MDAAALIGPPADGADAAATLCAALYAAGGVRAAPHLGTPQQQAAGTRWVRLALPVGIELPLASERVSHAFSLLMAEKASIALLKPGPASARGWLGELTRHYIPV